MVIQPGTKLGAYEILSPLGAGGMGEVYLARDPRLDRNVAVKILPERFEKDHTALSRFEREAKAVAALSHPNILEIHDLGNDQGITFVVTEFLEGETLKARIRHSKIPIDTALKIAADIVAGLAAAHSKGVIHRDLKPENVFLTSDGRVKILDFGLALYTPAIPKDEVTSMPTESKLTEAGMVMGTAPYMSPEQLRGEPIDHRTDIFSFGCVLFEMISGGTPAFTGNTRADLISAILTRDPFERKSAVLSNSESEGIIKRCLRKKPEDRYSSASELHSALQYLIQERSQPVTLLKLSKQIRKPYIAIPLAVFLLLILAAAIRTQQQNTKVRWARETAIPEIKNMIDAENFHQAFKLALQVEAVIPDDPELKKLWNGMSRVLSVKTVPDQANVYMKDYRSVDGNWESIGTSPVSSVRVPIGLLRWKIEKQGYQTIERSDRYPPFMNPGQNVVLTFVLDKNGSKPEDMVRVPAREFTLEIPGLDHLPPVQLEDYFIDRYELSNQQYQKFVKSGGYQNRSFWKHKFIKDGIELNWEQAMVEFRDGTGRPGPATWEAGNFPQGQENFPVTGVSWYEAAAYAEFAGKSLPSVYHWNYAAGTWDSAFVIPLSNFTGSGLHPVGSNSGLHRFGTIDMAGNAKEWCWNETAGKRYILGGAFNEPTYMFNDPDAQPPMSRLPSYGFRCVKLLKPVQQLALEAIPRASRDYRAEKPVGDEIFNVYKSLYSYDKTPIHPVIELQQESPEGWKTEKITFEAAYGNEKMITYLFLPKHSKPPYQTIIYFPGSGVIYQRSSKDLNKDVRNMSRIDFLIDSGRAVLYPIYKGTFERNGGLKSDIPEPTTFYRDHVMQWYKDVGRSIDFLETRKDIDAGKLGYVGSSWGGAMGFIIPAIESRFKASVLIVPGFYLQKTLPEVDQINFISRVSIPTLMLNGKYDFFLPSVDVQTAFELLGTPEPHKRQVLYDTGHDIPRKELIRETLDWFDRYLGPVSQ
jgi:serine/threonine protein kinase/dienelactone hydrolase